MVIDSQYYPTVEHYFQSMKASNANDAITIRNASSPAESKRLGKIVTLRPDWAQIKDQVMEHGLRCKFSNFVMRCIFLS